MTRSIQHSSPSDLFLPIALLGAPLMLLAGVEALRRAPCWGLLLSTAAVAWLLWLNRADRELFVRRAILQRAATDTAKVRRWFWAGRLKLFCLGFAAAGGAAVLLGIGASWQRVHWGILALDALLMAILYVPARRWLAREVRAQHQATFARIWPLTWINAAVLILAFVAADFYLARPVLSGSWRHIAETTWTTAVEGVSCPAAAALLGTVAVVDGLSWSAAVRTIPQLPDLYTLMIAWGPFLLWKSIPVLLYTQMLLGVAILCERLTDRQRAHANADTKAASSGPFLAALALIVVMVSSTPPPLRTVDLSVLGPGIGTIVEWTNPCRRPSVDVQNAQAFVNALAAERRAADRIIDERIDSAVQRSIARAEKGVDAYLDWYFSFTGAGMRTGAQIAGSSVVRKGTEIVDEWLGSRTSPPMSLEELLEREISRHVVEGSQFRETLSDAGRDTQRAVSTHMGGAAERLGVQVRHRIGSGPCALEFDLASLANLDQGRLNHAVAVTVGAAAPVMSRVLATRGPILARRLVMQPSIRMGQQRLAQGALRSTLRGARLVCASSGPAAAACFIVGTAGAEMILLEIDERRFREPMRKELLEEISRQIRATGEELKAANRLLADVYASEIDKHVQPVFFSPAKHGLSRAETT